MFKIYLSKNPEALKAMACHVTVEAEYGSVVVEGSELTLAHHQPTGPYSSRSQPAPCNNVAAIFDTKMVKRLHEAVNRDGELRVGLSHLDLDSVGGVGLIVSAVAQFPRDMLWAESTAEFWRVAEFVDLNGPHKLDVAPGVTDDIKRSLWAYWAWARVRSEIKPAEGQEVVEVGDEIGEHMRALGRIFDGREVAEDMILAGMAMRAAEHANDVATFVDEKGGVILRASQGPFVNHLYRQALGVVTFNAKTKTVTMSLADKIPGVSCRELVQKIWGPEAGGHDGIAGSPRDREMTMTDAIMARSALVETLSLSHHDHGHE